MLPILGGVFDFNERNKRVVLLLGLMLDVPSSSVGIKTLFSQKLTAKEGLPSLPPHIWWSRKG